MSSDLNTLGKPLFLLSLSLCCAVPLWAQNMTAPSGADSRDSQQQSPAPVNPESLSCRDLKERLQAAGQMTILSGPRGAWGDTFYGPAVPRCQFWQMPQFTYVRAADGLCGVGYICVDKLSFD